MGGKIRLCLRVDGYSAIFLETGLNTCGKGTQIWDCLPGCVPSLMFAIWLDWTGTSPYFPGYRRCYASYVPSVIAWLS